MALAFEVQEPLAAIRHTGRPIAARVRSFGAYRTQY